MLVAGMSTGRGEAIESGRPGIPALDELASFQDDQKVVRGRNGRLFLANDTNRVLDQHSGALRFTPTDLRRWRITLEDRFAWLAEHGIPYFFLIAPDAHSVYPEDLPAGVSPAGRRPVHQLIEELRRHGSSASVVYPLDALVAAKPAEIVYPKAETHWTARGAFIAYRVLAARIARQLPMTLVAEEDVRFYEVERAGDLGFKVHPRQTSVDVEASVLRPRAWLVSDNRIFNTGSMVSTRCPGAAPGTCLLFGDSYWRGVGRFLASSFADFVFVRTPRLDREAVAEVRPDVVVSVISERFLIRVPDDAGGESTKSVVARKQAEGVRRPRISMWRPIAERTEP
jgi:hypothetical protein